MVCIYHSERRTAANTVLFRCCLGREWVTCTAGVGHCPSHGTRTSWHCNTRYSIGCAPLACYRFCQRLPATYRMPSEDSFRLLMYRTCQTGANSARNIAGIKYACLFVFQHRYQFVFFHSSFVLVRKLDWCLSAAV